jgi:hypothetical protein
VIQKEGRNTRVGQKEEEFEAKPGMLWVFSSSESRLSQQTYRAKLRIYYIT